MSWKRKLAGQERPLLTREKNNAKTVLRGGRKERILASGLLHTCPWKKYLWGRSEREGLREKISLAQSRSDGEGFLVGRLNESYGNFLPL